MANNNEKDNLKKKKKSNKKPIKKAPSKILKTPKPNAGIENKYRKAILKKTKLMNKSLRWWLIANIKKNNPVAKLKKEFKKLSDYWDAEFAIFAKHTAENFVLNIAKASDDFIKNQGIVFNPKRKSKIIHNITKARINENIALIKSIPREEILRIESVFYKAVANLDRQEVSEIVSAVNSQLDTSEQITERRIKTIARDQTKKATEALSQARAQSNGFEYYIWITANDERVSTGEGGHKYLDGRIYKYGEDTAIIDSYGTQGTCGDRVNCRCTSGAVYLMPNETLEKVSDPQHGDYYIIVEKKSE